MLLSQIEEKQRSAQLAEQRDRIERLQGRLAELEATSPQSFFESGVSYATEPHAGSRTAGIPIPPRMHEAIHAVKERYGLASLRQTVLVLLYVALLHLDSTCLDGGNQS